MDNVHSGHKFWSYSIHARKQHPKHFALKPVIKLGSNCKNQLVQKMHFSGVNKELASMLKIPCNPRHMSRPRPSKILVGYK